ncbi:MAG: hypothetical protein NT157_05420 [Candidatus Micrarchaeota archaeon]|nr:hypothetical protein [Candidatus Micrarchaeota archaeon]
MDYMEIRTFLIGLLSVLLLSGLPYADVGPKPGIHFDLQYEMNPAPAILNATLLDCQLADCSDAHPMPFGGPQRIWCSGADSCNAIAYGFAPYMRLQLQFSDQIRTSNVFQEPTGLDSSYSVTVRANDLLVANDGNGNFSSLALLSLIVFALLITLVIELPVATIILWLWKKPMNFLLIAAGINILTVPALWLAIPLASSFMNSLLAFGILELLVFIIEAAALWKLSGEKLSLKQAGVLSAAMNLASMLAGTAVLGLVFLLAGS